jgi:hypothetical protein
MNYLLRLLPDLIITVIAQSAEAREVGSARQSVLLSSPISVLAGPHLRLRFFAALPDLTTFLLFERPIFRAGSSTLAESRHGIPGFGSRHLGELDDRGTS